MAQSHVFSVPAVKYEVIREKLKSDELGEYISYGISASDGLQNVKISDISVSEQNVKNLAMLLNRNKVSLEHFGDIVNDFIIV